MLSSSRHRSSSELFRELNGNSQGIELCFEPGDYGLDGEDQFRRAAKARLYMEEAGCDKSGKGAGVWDWSTEHGISAFMPHLGK